MLWAAVAGFYMTGVIAEAQVAEDAVLQTLIHDKSTAIANGDTGQIKNTSRKLCALTLRLMAGVKVRMGEYQESERLFQDSLNLEDNAATRAELAAAYLSWNAQGKALSVTKQLIEEAPEDAAAWKLNGQVQLASGDFSGASASLSRALQLHPELNTVFMLSTALLGSKEKEKAAQLFQQTVEQFGESATLHIGFGIAYQQSGSLENAIHEFERALILDPTVPNGHFLLGNAYLAKCAWSYNVDSAREFAAGVEQNPSDYKTNLALGLMDSGFGLYDDAAKYLHAASATVPSSPAPLLGLGFNAFDQEDFPMAKKYLDQAVGLHAEADDPLQIRRAYMILSKIAAMSADFTTAAAMFKQARIIENEMSATKTDSSLHRELLAEKSTNPSSAAIVAEHELTKSRELTSQLSQEERATLNTREQEYRHLLASSFNDWGTAEAKSGDYAAALKEFHNGERWDPDTAGLMENTGLAAYRLGDYAEAARALKLGSSRTQNVALRAMLASALFLNHDYSGAASAFAQVGDAIFDDPPMTYQWATALARSQEREQSLKVLSRLEPDKLAPDDAVAVGRLYLELAEFNLGLKYFRYALQQNVSVPGGHYGAGQALSHLNQNETAISELNEELRRNPSTPDAGSIHARLAELYGLLGRRSEADRELQLSKRTQ